MSGDLGDFRGLIQSSQYSRLHRGKFFFYRVPDDLVIDSVVAMPQYVAHAAKALPIHARTHTVPILSQTNRSLGDDL
jgi:hypothetical protein